MGQAKNRGPREVRVAEGIAKRETEFKQQEEDRRARVVAEKARIAALPPAQRARMRQVQVLLAAALGSIMSVTRKSA